MDEQPDIIGIEEAAAMTLSVAKWLQAVGPKQLVYQSQDGTELIYCFDAQRAGRVLETMMFTMGLG
jgi:hypothetical protein